LPLTHAIKEVNELTTHMKRAGSQNEMLKYDELIFRDPAERKYKAKDLWVIDRILIISLSMKLMAVLDLG
jgi:hypothetical protein